MKEEVQSSLNELQDKVNSLLMKNFEIENANRTLSGNQELLDI